ncbi:hypothetical protein ARSEF4850_000716 [Beauveria asiatica]
MGTHIPPSSASSSRRTRRMPPTRLLLLVVLCSLAGPVAASPYPRGDILHDARYAYLLGRTCASFCGENGQYCCGGGEHCTTLPNNVATCVADGAVASPLYTTTWTETRTYTSTILTWFLPPPAPTAGVDCVPQRPEWEACGEICCAGWQTCAFKGQCSAKPGYGEPTTVIVTNSGVVTTQYSAPYRVTGTTTITNTGVRPTDAGTTTGTPTSTSSTRTATATQDPDGATGGGGTSGTANNKLSGGAIAGIVIGSLAAAGLLILLCFCCIARGLFNALFGKKREKTDQYDDRSTSVYSRRDRHSGWFGGGGGRPSSVSDRRSEKKSSGAWWLGLAGAAAGLLALLNIKKKKEVPRKTPSRYTDSYYSYSDYTGISPSSASSGRRTTRTGRTARSGRSRTSRASRSRFDSRSRVDSRSRMDSRSRIESRMGVTKSAYTARSSSRHD